GRDLRRLRRDRSARPRRKHPFANRLGAARVDRSGARRLQGCQPRRALPRRSAAVRWSLGRGIVHRMRFPRLWHRRGARGPHRRGPRAVSRIHDPVPLVPELLSAARAGPLPRCPSRDRARNPERRRFLMRSEQFYQGHLDAVSRSFALCIPQLATPFRQHVALSYLLLRVLDTVEDASFADKLHQQRQFTAFRQFLVRPPTGAQVDAFNASFPDNISDSERALLADTGAFLEDAYGLPAAARAVMFSAIDRMALGMAAYARRPATRLVDLEDVSRYCCIVAGLVGEMLTR